MREHWKMFLNSVDNTWGQVLKMCAEKQCGIIFICHISLQQQKVPEVYVKSIIVPVAKSINLESLNDFRPVALTSLVMKCFDNLIRHEIFREECNLVLAMGGRVHWSSNGYSLVNFTVTQYWLLRIPEFFPLTTSCRTLLWAELIGLSCPL